MQQGLYAAPKKCVNVVGETLKNGPEGKLVVVRVETSGASTDAGRAGEARGTIRLEASSVTPEGTSALEVKTPGASTDAKRVADAVEVGT